MQLSDEPAGTGNSEADEKSAHNGLEFVQSKRVVSHNIEPEQCALRRNDSNSGRRFGK